MCARLKGSPPSRSPMKGQIVSILTVVALIVGVGIGYFGNTATSNTTTQTIVETYTTATTITTTITTTLPQGSVVEKCVITEYHVWMIGIIETSSTAYGTSTQSYDVQTYQTTTSVTQPVGFATTATTSYTGTLTGAIAYWNSTVCTHISG